MGLKLELLSFLSDVQSLRSTVLTCSSFYDAFIPYESLTLRRQLPDELLPEAIAAWESSRKQPMTWWGVCEFVEEHFRSRKPPPESWTLSAALGVSKLHSYIEHFADDFANLMLEESFKFSQIVSPPSGPLSRYEIVRVSVRFIGLTCIVTCFKMGNSLISKRIEIFSVRTFLI